MKQEEKQAVEITHLRKSFSVGIQEVPVLKDISFTIARGDFTVIFGPSGCGKSTLLHSLLGLETPTSGDVSVFGTPLYHSLTEDQMSDFRKKHIGVVYQSPNWISALTVLENVEIPLLLLGQDSSDGLSKATGLLDSLQMANWANYLPTELSSGQQQKVALARSLITNPDLIVADEPTGNLDFASGRELMELLAKINGQGKTIIMVTHDLEFTAYAKTVIEMLDGKIVRTYQGKERKMLLTRPRMKRGIGTLERVVGSGTTGEQIQNTPKPEGIANGQNGLQKAEQNENIKKRKIRGSIKIPTGENRRI